MSNYEVIKEIIFLSKKSEINTNEREKLVHSLNQLTSLIVNGYNVGDTGAQLLAGALKTNKTLTKLDLNCNEIGESGAKAIADVLKMNNTLTGLNMHYNIIGDAGAQAIANALKVNNTLTELNINLNDIGNIGAEAMMDALKVNNALTVLILRYNQLKIEELLKRNKEIQTTLCRRIFECKNAHLSLLDYKILQKVNVAVICKETSKFKEEHLELISLNTFSKYFLFILGVCKFNQIPPSRTHLLGIPKEILNHIGSFLNPKDFSNIKTK